MKNRNSDNSNDIYSFEGWGETYIRLQKMKHESPVFRVSHKEMLIPTQRPIAKLKRFMPMQKSIVITENNDVYWYHPNGDGTLTWVYLYSLLSNLEEK